jgi:RHS repeat-associated protein
MIFRSTAIAHIQKGKSAIAHKGSNGGAIASYGYSYDAANRINRMTTPDGATTYRYDQRNQLLGTDSNYQADEAYEYDANGDRTGAGYQSEGNNRLASDGFYTYSYDDEGNLTSKVNLSDNSSTVYGWDNRNRLVAMTQKDGNGDVTQSILYRYDVFNRRIAKVIDADGSGAGAAQVERMVYNGNDIALTFDGNGTQTHRYMYGVGVDAIASDEDATGTVRWAMSDHQGSVRDVIDSNGSILNHIVYDSYGQVESETNTAVDLRYGYTGRDRDEESGLNYYRARYYDPASGRFISEDAIGFGGGDENLYRYVLNSPTNYIDPDGEFAIPIGVGVALGIGAVGVTGVIAWNTYQQSQQSQTATAGYGGSLFGDGESVIRARDGFSASESVMPTVVFDEPLAPRDSAHEPLSDEERILLDPNAAIEFQRRCQEILEQLSRELGAPHITRTGSDEFVPIPGGGFDLGNPPSLRDLIFTASDEVAPTPQNVLEGISNNNRKHARRHLPEFQELDPSMTDASLRNLGASIVKPENLISRPEASQKVYEQVISIGGHLTRVRVALNEENKLHSVHIRR